MPLVSGIITDIPERLSHRTEPWWVFKGHKLAWEFNNPANKGLHV